MATISEYMSGKICEQISLALSIMDDAPTGQLNNTKTGKALLRNVGELEPRKMKVEEWMKSGARVSSVTGMPFMQ